MSQQIELISPMTAIAGIPQTINYNPLEGIENRNLEIEDNNSSKTLSVWELAAFHIEHNQKLPESLRDIFLKLINPQITRTNRLEFPFFTRGNKLAVEVFWGNKRLVCFEDLSCPDMLRCVEIPYDTTDPESHIK